MDHTRPIEKGACIQNETCGIGRVIHVRDAHICTIHFDNFIATATTEENGKYTIKLPKHRGAPICGQTLKVLCEQKEGATASQLG